MKSYVHILDDGTLIRQLDPIDLQDPVTNIRNAKHGVNGFAGKVIGRLVVIDGKLSIEDGEWEVDPSDKRDVPADQKKRKWVPSAP